MNLENKVVIVTGAGGGIGRATALRLAHGGASVACVDINSESVGITAELIGETGGKALPLVLDLGTEEGNEAMISDTVAAFGRLDALHSNAAAQRIGRLPDSSIDDWETMFQVNLLGTSLGIKFALPHLAENGGGSVVITASLLGLVGDADMPAYGAMKGGLIALCKSLATAHGPDNIRVNTISPADIRTPMNEEYFDSQPDPEAARQRVIQHYPLRRFGMPEEVGDLVAFLVSDESSYITGIDIPIDGGLLAQIY